jgi:hypothetical protein
VLLHLGVDYIVGGKRERFQKKMVGRGFGVAGLWKLFLGSTSITYGRGCGV